ncbi:phosphohistidine phosphatase SixA [Rhabdobacter roseus]|uniref:Phosphohistidine phosphatase n=1 Tax=Rhabdobacter roseus TaxID=1655419 RepID=A0A840U3W1_9BACT|nr:histidine phosphatase family protein [Rhabdobacter roseus]MBB5286529.1 phosphohistidine phosphatase [Rhabdobacter roseus]
MMKKLLYLVRHGQAEDRAPMFRDFERELTSQGIMDSARMGKYLAQKSTQVDRMVTSSAARAYQTAKVMAEQLGYEQEAIVCVDKLYDGGPQAYLEAVNTTPENCSVLMLFGHNPDITYFGEYLTRSDVSSMEKGAVAIYEFEDLSWAEVSAKTARLLGYESPRQIRLS